MELLQIHSGCVLHYDQYGILRRARAKQRLLADDSSAAGAALCSPMCVCHELSRKPSRAAKTCIVPCGHPCASMWCWIRGNAQHGTPCETQFQTTRAHARQELCSPACNCLAAKKNMPMQLGNEIDKHASSDFCSLIYPPRQADFGPRSLLRGVPCWSHHLSAESARSYRSQLPVRRLCQMEDAVHQERV